MLKKVSSGKSNYRFYPYKIGSESAKALSTALNGLQVKQVGNYKPKPEHHIINWGNSQYPEWHNPDVRILNEPDAVALASNKFSTFIALQKAGIATPDFASSIDDAFTWWREGYNVYCRKKLNGHSGEGITIIKADENFPQGETAVSPLYTKGINVKAEYRVHVFNGEVIDYIKKRRAVDDVPTDDQLLIRSHDNGWIFTRENLNRLERVEQLAIDAVEALGLDFGAVDIIKDFDNNCYVCEVNTACGLEGTTLENYLTAIRNYFN